MAELYLIANSAMPTTAAQATVTTGNVIKSLMQVTLNASQTFRAKVVEWGISFDGSAAATPIKCELLTVDVAGTVTTAYAAADIINLDPNGTAVTDDFPFDLSANKSGFPLTAEGTITVVRMFDVQLIAPTNQYVKQWPLGREPSFKQGQYLRVRVTAGSAVNAYSYVVIEV